jgi:hypothetical protein
VYEQAVADDSDREGFERRHRRRRRRHPKNHRLRREWTPTRTDTGVKPADVTN